MNLYLRSNLGFQDPLQPNHVCRLKRALYDLRQDPRAWFDRFSLYLLSLGFSCGIEDTSVSVNHNSEGTILLLVYVDDIILTGNNPHPLS